MVEWLKQRQRFEKQTLITFYLIFVSRLKIEMTGRKD